MSNAKDAITEAWNRAADRDPPKDAAIESKESSVINRLNNVARQLAEFTRNRYFEFVPVDRIESIANDSSIGVDFRGFAPLGNGRQEFALYDNIKDQQLSSKQLVVTWHEMGSGNYEVVAYVAM